MWKKIAILSVYFLYSYSLSQTITYEQFEDLDYTDVYEHGAFSDSALIHSFGNHVNVRASASLDSKVVAQLDYGEKVMILGYQYTKINYSDHWYQVKLGNGEKGFVWGANLARGAWKVRFENGFSGLFMVGRKSLPGEVVPGKITFRLVRDKALLADQTFDVSYILCDTSYISSSRGSRIWPWKLEHVGDISSNFENGMVFSLSHSNCHCGCSGENLFFAWQNGNFHFLLATRTGGYKGDYESVNSVLHQGIPIVVLRSQNYGEEGSKRFLHKKTRMIEFQYDQKKQEFIRVHDLKGSNKMEIEY